MVDYGDPHFPPTVSSFIPKCRNAVKGLGFGGLGQP